MSALRTAIQAAGIYITDFIESVSGLSGVKVGTVQNHLYGYGAGPGVDEIAAFSILLGVSEGAVRDMIIPLCAEKNEGCQSDSVALLNPANVVEPVKKDGDSKETMNWYVGDMKAITKLMNRHGLSVGEFEAAIGATYSGMYYKWVKGRKISGGYAERIAQLFKVDMETLFTLVGTVRVAIGSNPNKKRAEQKDEAVALKSVEGMLDVFEIFKTLNGNLQTMTSEMIRQNRANGLRIDEAISAMENSLLSLSQRMDIIERKLEEICLAVSGKKEAKDISILDEGRGQITIKCTGTRKSPREIDAMPYDTYRHYAAKIDAMASEIGRIDGESRDDVLHRFYQEMNKVYGVVYDQLKAEYKRKHGILNQRTIALLYDNPLFGSIFYNLVYSEFANKVKSAAKIKWHW